MIILLNKSYLHINLNIYIKNVNYYYYFWNQSFEQWIEAGKTSGTPFKIVLIQELTVMDCSWYFTYWRLTKKPAKWSI